MTLEAMFDTLQEIHEDHDVDLDEKLTFLVDGSPVSFDNFQVDEDDGSVIIRFES